MSRRRPPKLTPHQAEVFGRLDYLSGLDEGSPWVAAPFLGSRGALRKLVDKGYAQVKVQPGSHGAERLFYRAVTS